MLKKFNPWQLWGAFALIWIVVVTAYAHDWNIRQARQFSDSIYKMCEGAAHNGEDLAKCASERENNFSLSNPTRWDAPTAFAGVTFVVSSIYICLIYYLVSSFTIGIKAKISWSGRSRFQRVIIIGAAIFLFLNIVFVYFLAANGVVDRKVPVSIPGTLDIRVTDGYASAAGTWVLKADGLLDKPSENSLSTSRFECFRDKMRCTESTATINTFGSGPYLSLDQYTHDVSTWDGNVVTIVEDNLCNSELFIINGNSSTFTHDFKPHGDADKAACKPLIGAAEGARHYELSKGFDVYWAMRQSARPRLLKAIQALFGN